MLMESVITMTKLPSDPASRLTIIRQLNDELRHRLPRAQRGGRVLITAHVQRLTENELAGLLFAVRDFATFSTDNDPHSEHDFGAIQQNDERYFWKIEYFDPSMEFSSPDPSDPTVTTRLLTIMRADEY